MLHADAAAVAGAGRAGRDRLTTDTFWRGYWAAHGHRLLRTVDGSMPGCDVLRRCAPTGRRRSFIEVGGFPGYYSIFARTRLGCRATLLDSYIDREAVSALCAHNGVADSIELIEGDLFCWKPRHLFELVFSSGFIEHFADTEAVVAAHARLARRGGHVVIQLPNFRGLNGLLQACFDRPLLRAHNRRCMDLSFLRTCFERCGLRVLSAEYCGMFNVWLESIEQRALALRWLVRSLNYLGNRVVRPAPSQLASPYIVVVGQKR
ncbi:MAG: methyltransferase domain-containing protein [Deltaproteobacteria bacterium]|nr:methyltransferase domain-containing protein [Deltaproteobacteria bacterium]